MVSVVVWQNYQLADDVASGEIGGLALTWPTNASQHIFWTVADGSLRNVSQHESGKWTRTRVSDPATTSLKYGISAVSRTGQALTIWSATPTGSLISLSLTP